MKISILTLGCKVNKYESDAIMQELLLRGYDVNDKLEFADAYVINTCAVTNEAEKKSRQMIERAKKFNPDAKFYIMGCASQKNKKQFEDKNVTAVIGNANKMGIVDIIEGKTNIEFAISKDFEDMKMSKQNLSRAFIKIQDGCNNFCTYCIIPYLRGRSRSREISSILNEVEKMPENVKEIVLVGIDVADFKIGDEKALGTLLKRLDVYGKRLRLSSMEDNLVTEEFVKELSQVKNFCPHFHLSLQSGCDNVLKKMNRHYTTADFERTVNLIRKYFPLAGITTDIIVCFPNETEEDFEETMKFVEKIKFSQLHLFPFSMRDGTAAAKLYKDLNGDIKADRLKRLDAVGKKTREEFLKANKSGKVLVEEKNGQYYEGYTENYIKCYFKEKCKVGDVVEVEIIKPFKDGVLAKKC